MATRILLLGLGFWGSRWYEVIARSEGWTLAGAAGAPQDLATLGLGGPDGPPTWTDYRAAIAEAEADAVLIVLPTALHIDAGIRALERGFHVLSEKPLASDLSGAITLRDAARRFPQQVYMVNQNYRLRPHNQTLRQAVADGLIGELGGFHLEFRQPEFMVGDRPGLEMPLIQDMSIHHFDLMRFLSGVDAVEISARSYRPPWSHYRGLPATEATVVMANDMVIGYSGTWAARGRYTSWDGDITLTGSRGCLRLDAANRVELFADEGPDPTTYSGMGPRDDAGRLLDPLAMPRPELDHSLELFRQSVVSGTPPPTSLEDNFRSFAMVAAAEASSRTWRPVRVAS